MSILLLIVCLAPIPDRSAWRVEQAKGERVRFSGAGHLLWNFLAIDDVECVSQINDVNGDGISDVLAESYDAGASGLAHFFCLSGSTGETIWAVWPQGGVSNSGGWGDQCVSSCPDLNGDGYSDALLGTAWGGRTVFAINGKDGAVLWSYDTYHDSIASGWVYCVNWLPDVDGDSIPEVLATTGKDCKTVFCFSGAGGQILWRFYAQDALGSVCAINDLNNDGYADVVAGAWGNNEDQHVYCISGKSQGNQPQVLWSYDAQGDVYCVRTIPDINHNGNDDVVASTWSDYIYCLEGGSGEPLWSSNIGNYGMRIELLSDITGDTVPEIIVGSWNDAVILLDGKSGAEIWRTPVGNDAWTVYPLSDVSGDGQPDVLAGSGDGKVYCLNGTDGELIWDYSTGGWVNSVRSISDVNGDGASDAIAGNQFSGSPGYVYCIQGDTIATGIREREKFFFAPALGGTRVYDATGRRVLRLKSGVYFLISQEAGAVVKKKLLILR